ncbi:uncharacterized protein LOC111353822 [Spodoptera litura]|uniref:Uncharacterized protein LOC111353822 n=1 Tax=Spodoptera litura TaxID=69820 RepID=A0A9J7E4C7_SPOLT|nr:uncharacterized protein LOC111353822 [Spodoptera litura]
MALYYIFIIINVLNIVFRPCWALEFPKNETSDLKHSTITKRSTYETDKKYVLMPKYSIYLIGFTMLIMLIAIIALSVALYRAIKKRSKFGVNENSQQYIRQESTAVIPLYNSTYDEQNKNNGSTLTVNSGIIEISEPRISEPESPTRVDDSRIVFTRKPIKPIVPVMPRGQMDAICKEVLRRVQKSDSASFRDLNEMLSGKKDENEEEKCETVDEAENEKKHEEKTEPKIELPQSKLSESNITPELLLKLNARSQQLQNQIEDDMKNETKQENPIEKTHECNDKSKADINSDVHIEIDYININKIDDSSSSETEYDTVPTPIRFRHSGPEPDNLNVEDIPVYDLPPRRSHDGHTAHVGNMVQIDQDSEYMMPLSEDKTDSCYINAKRNSFNL